MWVVDSAALHSSFIPFVGGGNTIDFRNGAREKPLTGALVLFSLRAQIRALVSSVGFWSPFGLGLSGSV